MSETDISTAAVERLLDGVTAGPWATGDHGRVEAYRGFSEEDRADYWQAVADFESEADAIFTINARDLVPALLADRDRLAAEVARLTAERDAAMAGRVKVKPLVWDVTYFVGHSSGSFEFFLSEHEAAACADWLGRDYNIYDENDLGHYGERLRHEKEAWEKDTKRLHEASVLAALQPDTERTAPVAWRYWLCPSHGHETECRWVYDDDGNSAGFLKPGALIEPLYTTPQPAPAPQAREITVQEAARVLLSNDIAIARMAEGIHDGPLMADDHEFSAARPQGSWCVDAVRAALRTLAAMQKGG